MAAPAAPGAPPAVVAAMLAQATACLIHMHGLGDAGSSWAPAFGQLQKAVPGLKVVCPNAPNAPVTLNGGMRMPSWHDIRSLGDMKESDLVGLDASVAMVRGVIEAEIAAGVPPERIIVSGFSQGAALAVATGYSFNRTLGGVVALSGYMPREDFAGSHLHDANRATPALVCHGTADMVVRFALGQDVHRQLAAAGVPATFKQYAGMGHSSSPQEIRDIAEFVIARLAARDEL